MIPKWAMVAGAVGTAAVGAGVYRSRHHDEAEHPRKRRSRKRTPAGFRRHGVLPPRHAGH